MATKKTDTIQENETVQKDELIKQMQEQMQEQQRQMAEMQRALLNFQNINLNANTKSIQEDDFVTYEIGCRFVSGVTIYSPRKEVEKDLPFNRTVEIDKYELDMLLKNNQVKDWLEKDILYFTDETLYEKKRLKKFIDLSDEALINLLKNNDVNETMNKLKEITKNYMDDPMVHCLFYRIVELSYYGKLSNINYEIRRQIEKVFNFKIDDANMYFASFAKIR